MLLYFAYLVKLCLKINKLTKCSFSSRLFLLCLEFTEWSEWRNETEGGYIRKRTCVIQDEETNVETNQSNCSGPYEQKISNEILMPLYQYTYFCTKNFT